MRRGEIWTVAGGKDYAGKPRPVVILQDDRFDATASITVCGLTTNPTDPVPIAVEPNTSNGLRTPCRLMVDKITTVPKSMIGSLIGHLDDEDVLRLKSGRFGVPGPGRPSPRDPGPRLNGRHLCPRSLEMLECKT